MSEIPGSTECYAKYRGKCRSMSEAAVAADPTLRLVRGHYFCPIYGQQAHWWTVRPDGTIYDPTALQFPSNGHGEYVEFDGWHDCAECGKKIREEDAAIGGNGHYAFCSGKCYARFVGVEV
jgi:hypothetical protein